MFSTLALNFLVASVFAISAFSSPITGRSGARSPVRRHHSYPSFDNYNSIGTMSNFDGFYGQNNFGGHNRHQTIIQQTPELVCQSVQVNIVQQRLAVISEMARRVVTEFSCEVETQVIAFEQFYQSMGYFSDDLRRHSGYQVGYDQNIVSHFDDWYNSDGSLCTDDWGFQGSDIGSQTRRVGILRCSECVSRPEFVFLLSILESCALDPIGCTWNKSCGTPLPPAEIQWFGSIDALTVFAFPIFRAPAVVRVSWRPYKERAASGKFFTFGFEFSSSIGQVALSHPSAPPSSILLGSPCPGRPASTPQT
uniref:Uncharacterized protein n=1 Tax=Mycena chlorophos TaxID=658473 RepID=A0ABQ0MBP9_MYCCL|nr:predicted protein [Mycena chlorophos]